MATLPVRSLQEYLIAPSEADAGPESFANRQKGDVMGPIENWSDELLALAVKQRRPEAIAEQARRTGSVSTASPAPPLPMPADEVKADATAPNLGVNNFLRGLAAARSEPATGVGSPRPVAAPLPVRSKGETKRPAQSFPEYAAPSFTLEAIPTASAPATQDTTAPVTANLPPTGPRTPAGKPDSAGTQGLPAPSATPPGAGGDDEMTSLRKQLGLQQMIEALGSAGSGKNLYTDGGVLLDRMKQIEALRAKREEQSLEQQRERATWGASNRGTLNSLLAQFKDNPVVSDALMALEPSIETTKPSDFQKASTAAIMTRPKVEGIQATTKKTKAGTGQILERTATDVATRPGKVRKLQTAADLDQAKIDKLRRETAANALGLTRSAKAVEAAGKGKVPSKDAIKYIRDDIRTAEKAITPTLENFKNIERASPGFAFGKPDKTIETMDFVAAEKLPAFANKARDLRSAVEALIVDIRHGSFGASLTAPEKASFETMLNTGLTGTVAQLSRAIDMVRRKAAATAQTHFNTSMTFYPTETAQVLSTSSVFGPATAKGGVYSDVWSLPTAPASRSAKPEDAPGKKTLWNKKTGQWVRYTPEQEAKARAAGAVED